MGNVSLNTDSFNAQSVGGFLPSSMYINRGVVADCNLAVLPGVYAISTPFTNAPLGTYGIIRTEIFEGGWIYQTFIPTDPTVTYIRSKINNSGWGGWIAQNQYYINLLDNPSFLVNQRREKTYTATLSAAVYTADRWKLHVSGTSESLSTTLTTYDNGGVSIQKSGDTVGDGWWWITQPLSDFVYNVIAGTDVYVIVGHDHGTFTGRIPVPSSKDSEGSLADCGNGIYVNIYAGTLRIFSKTESVSIYGVKLSQGETVFNISDYSTELLKCQRYYRRIYASELPLALRQYISPTSNLWTMTVPCNEMRVVPTVTFHFKYTDYENGCAIETNTNIDRAATFSTSWYTSNTCVKINIDAPDADPSSPLYIPHYSDSYIELSADL